MIKALIIAASLLVNPGDSLSVMFWNVENFFDYRNDSTCVADAEFSSRGDRRWTKKRFYHKCDLVAKSIFYADMPDIIGFAEIENEFVLNRIIYSTNLRKLNYRTVHFDSPDHRGIDVGLIYRADRVKLLEKKAFHVYRDSIILQTRDILYTRFEGDLALFIVHLPSQFSRDDSRELCIRRLDHLIDSLGVSKVLVMGDFNETPEKELFKLLKLQNLGLTLSSGSIRYNGRWELIDLFFVSPSLEWSGLKILEIPFLQTLDTQHGGTKPLRTYVGPRYTGGVSDHLPIYINIHP